MKSSTGWTEKYWENTEAREAIAAIAAELNIPQEAVAHVAAEYEWDIEDPTTLQELVEDMLVWVGGLDEYARYLVEEENWFGELSDELLRYINYDYFGRDLEVSGNYCAYSDEYDGSECVMRCM